MFQAEQLLYSSLGENHQKITFEIDLVFRSSNPNSHEFYRASNGRRRTYRHRTSPTTIGQPAQSNILGDGPILETIVITGFNPAQQYKALTLPAGYSASKDASETVVIKDPNGALFGTL